MQGIQYGLGCLLTVFSVSIATAGQKAQEEENSAGPPVPCGDRSCNPDQYCEKITHWDWECRLCVLEFCHEGHPNFEEACPLHCDYVWQQLQLKKQNQQNKHSDPAANSFTSPSITVDHRILDQEQDPGQTDLGRQVLAIVPSILVIMLLAALIILYLMRQRQKKRGQPSAIKSDIEVSPMTTSQDSTPNKSNHESHPNGSVLLASVSTTDLADIQKGRVGPSLGADTSQAREREKLLRSNSLDMIGGQQQVVIADVYMNPSSEEAAGIDYVHGHATTHPGPLDRYAFGGQNSFPVGGIVSANTTIVVPVDGIRRSNYESAPVDTRGSNNYHGPVPAGINRPKQSHGALAADIHPLNQTHGQVFGKFPRSDQMNNYEQVNLPADQNNLPVRYEMALSEEMFGQPNTSGTVYDFRSDQSGPQTTCDAVPPEGHDVPSKMLATGKDFGFKL